MVRMPIKDIDIKKMKMAKDVLAVFSILGITEEDLDNLYELKDLKVEMARMQEEIDQLRKAIKNVSNDNLDKPTNSYSQGISKSFKGTVEDYHLNGKR